MYYILRTIWNWAFGPASAAEEDDYIDFEQKNDMIYGDTLDLQLVLRNCGDNESEVVKAVEALTGLGYGWCEALCSTSPRVIPVDFDRIVDLDAAFNVLANAGADAVVTPFYEEELSAHEE